MYNLSKTHLNKVQNKKLQLQSLILIKKYKQEQMHKINQHNKNIYLLNQYNKKNIEYIPKSKFVSIIPLKLYTHWHTKDVPKLMNENYMNLKKENPEFEFTLFDEADSRNFIVNNFDEHVINAYDKLKPCAYKCDLFRYCVLYINGGIYLDIKYNCTNKFKLIELIDKEYFVRDIHENYIYNALIVCKPGNAILFQAINQIVKNVGNNYYGNDCLEPTGPGLLGSYVSQMEINDFDLYHEFTVIDNIMSEYYIVYKDIIILQSYKEYRQEQQSNQKQQHYGELWNNRNIYN
jgi:mannosyltransferase OCH1-like enzyme